MNIRLPNITGATAPEQLVQIRSYLYQLAGELQWSLDTLEKGMTTTAPTTATIPAGNTTAEKEMTAQANFNEVKALIIKSADIVNAYYAEIDRRLSGIYVAESDFGIYREETDALLTANSTAIKQVYTNMQQILSDIAEVSNDILEVNAHIKTGLLYYDGQGFPVYGLEIGQRGEIAGAEVFHKYARFTSDKLSFYDNNDTEVAFLSDRKLYITNAEITGSLTLGGFVQTALTNGDVVKKWMKGG